MKPARPLLLALLAAVAACGGDPDIDQGLAPTGSAVIAGDAVITVPLPEAHPVALFLAMVADADGAPVPSQPIVDVTIIPASAFAADGGGVRTGPFAFGLVAPATYVVSGLVDVDENFTPLDPDLAGPTPADLLGGHIDVATRQLAPIQVGPEEVVGEVTVLFAAAPGAGAGRLGR